MCILCYSSFLDEIIFPKNFKLIGYTILLCAASIHYPPDTNTSYVNEFVIYYLRKNDVFSKSI